MPKLFHKGEWFYELSPTALMEAEFERILVQNAEIIRPNTKIVPYKRTVYAGDASAQADLAIISEDYRDWLVVEVEMVRHSLYGHVLPQIQTLRDASYGPADARYLANKDPYLDPEKMAQMMRGNSPEVLVITNKYDNEWEREIQRSGAKMITFEIYKSEFNKYIFSVDGAAPSETTGIITKLEIDTVLGNFLVVASPAMLDFQKGVQVPIFVGDQMTEWERIDIQTTCYLTPVGRMPLTRGRKYGLFRDRTGLYAIEPLS